MSAEELAEQASERTGWDAATRDRIVRSAAELVLRLGVAGASIERVRAASGVSRSQVCRYFPTKEALIDAVVDFQIAAVLARQCSWLRGLKSVVDLQEWADDVVESNRARNGARGCPLGSLVSQLAEQSGSMRAKLDDAFQTWQSYLAAGLGRMRDRGELNAEADVAELATGIVAALQGGLILAQAARSEKPLRAALDLAVGRVALATHSAPLAAPARVHGAPEAGTDASTGPQSGSAPPTRPCPEKPE
ncbi:TetR/AcrR family transcriptional regulator [Pseudonocardia humida]|uniref:TetR/AcrR family transcriptional regulator n=1 Tax=Pseudonocardia humida TaxID=2800819 RepID=A0ABT1AC81_9PSEU|nr:TetR family transcriptional regulator C-terminal domain-containing protein [Pseudonocardia humida]MCO1660528.1 TetR/AcrR family transcriptional regulator [Pseudonocardia humida]